MEAVFRCARFGRRFMRNADRSVAWFRDLFNPPGVEYFDRHKDRMGDKAGQAFGRLIRRLRACRPHRDDDR